MPAASAWTWGAIDYRPTLDLPRILEWIIAYYRTELIQPAAEERPARTLSMQ